MGAGGIRVLTILIPSTIQPMNGCSNYRFRDPHPTDPNLVYMGCDQGKPRWVTREKMEARIKKMGEYNQRNREDLAAKARQRYQDPIAKAAHQARCKAYATRNKEEIKLRHKARMASDPAYAARERAINAARATRRLSRSPQLRAIHNVRMHTGYFVKAIAEGKLPRTTKKLVGVDAATLKQHIEGQFTEGMSWENRGQWEVDHIIPLSATLRYPESLGVLALHWNLRPVWRKQNTWKGDTMPLKGEVAEELRALLPTGLLGELG